ncbi:UBX domain-containing protein 1 [Tanacetum coccineum]
MVVRDVDSKLLEELESMGFSKERSIRALHFSNEWLDVFYALQDLWQFKHQFTPNASDQDLQQKTEGKGSGKGRSKITGKRGAHKEKKREEEDDDTRTVYERSKGFILYTSSKVIVLIVFIEIVDGLSMKDWRGRRAVSFNIISSGASLYKGKGQTLSQVGFAMTINKSQGQTLPQQSTDDPSALQVLLPSQ